MSGQKKWKKEEVCVWFKCKMCRRNYPSKQDLIVHWREEHAHLFAKRKLSTTDDKKEEEDKDKADKQEEDGGGEKCRKIQKIEINDKIFMKKGAQNNKFANDIIINNKNNDCGSSASMSVSPASVKRSLDFSHLGPRTTSPVPHIYEKNKQETEEPGPSSSSSKEASQFLTERNARDAASAVVIFPQYSKPTVNVINKTVSSTNKLANLRKKTFKILLSNDPPVQKNINGGIKKEGGDHNTQNKGPNFSASIIAKKILGHEQRQQQQQQQHQQVNSPSKPYAAVQPQPQSQIQTQTSQSSQNNMMEKKIDPNPPTSTAVPPQPPPKKEEEKKIVYVYKCHVCSLRYKDLDCLLEHSKQHAATEESADKVTGNGTSQSSSSSRKKNGDEENEDEKLFRNGRPPQQQHQQQQSSTKWIRNGKSSEDFFEEKKLPILKNSVLQKNGTTTTTNRTAGGNGNGFSFACVSCPKKFSAKKILQDHIRIFHGEKIFVKSNNNNSGGSGNFKQKKIIRRPEKRPRPEVDMSIYEDDNDEFDDDGPPIAKVVKTESLARKIKREPSSPTRQQQRSMAAAAAAAGEDSCLKYTIKKYVGKRVIFLCKFCNKEFRCMSVIKNHIMTHTGERNFKCTRPGCQKRFVTRNDQLRHERGPRHSTQPMRRKGRNIRDRRRNEPLLFQDPIIEEEIPDQEWPYYDNSGRLYCICKEVSFGPMVGCDNDDCEMEWFHFPCVGITEEPVGEWFCPPCSEARQQQPKLANKKTTTSQRRKAKASAS